MPTIDEHNSKKIQKPRIGRLQLSLFIIGLFSPLFSFMLAVSPLNQAAKIVILAGVAILYLAIGLWSFRRMRSAETGPSLLRTGAEARASFDLEGKLLALEEANQFFGTTLNPNDMFRLVASRVREIHPFQAAMLFLPAESGTGLRIEFYEGFGETVFAAEPYDVGSGLAGMAFLSGEISAGRDRLLQTIEFPENFELPTTSSIAIPMVHNGEVFAVFQIVETEENSADASMLKILETVGDRVAPLFLGSLAYEKSVSTALTDALTRLPNERAFFMVLETQLAESQRFRDERPLTVLTADIKGFAEVNEAYGYAAGDKILTFVAERIGGQLRKMDFLARSVNDEFVMILPTAGEQTAVEVIERIKESLAECPFPVSEHETIKLWLNFGWATFWQDGETAKQLLQAAVLRKQQAKSADPAKVVWFPKEYVN